MSLMIIEGCTCAGKTTLMRKMCLPGGYYLPAPEHTPPAPKEGEDLLQRQLTIFNDFYNFCLKLDDPHDRVVMIADFSPMGCIAFSRAIGRITGDERFFEQADEFAAVCRERKWNIYRYLQQPANVIIDRLKHRGRAGDDVWSEEFIKILVEEYDKVFVGKEW